MGGTHTRMTRPRTLTGRQRRFVNAYVETLDAPGAALAAGYSPRHAARMARTLLAKRFVIEAIIRAARALGEAAPTKHAARTDGPAGITREWITAELTQLYETVKACLPRPGDEKRPVPSGASLQNAIRMLELLIKHLETDGLSETDQDGDDQPDLSKLDRDDLRQLEAILARTLPDAGPARTRPAQP